MTKAWERKLVSRINWLTEGYSNHELARLCNSNHESVRRWRAGEVKAPARFLAELCEVFGANGDWMLLGRGKWDKK